MQSLLGTFLRERNVSGSLLVVSFRNPVIRDFSMLPSILGVTTVSDVVNALFRPLNLPNMEMLRLAG